MTRKQNFQSEEVKLGLVSQSASEGGKSVFRQTNSRQKQVIQVKKSSPDHSSITRGYIKLSDAAKAFHYNFRDKTVLDIGSSTGGFTKYALDHGAKKVIAVEKGTNQMLPSLRYDKRIDLFEKTDIFTFKPDYLLDTIVADVSFLSLKKILHYAKTYLAGPKTDFLVMLKPQFEAKPSQLTSGVVKNNKIRRDIIKNFEFWLKENGFSVIDKRDNQLKGKNGNIERFYWLRKIQ